MAFRSYVNAAFYIATCIVIAPVCLFLARVVVLFDLCMKAAPFRDAFDWMLRFIAPVRFLVTQFLKPAYRESYATNGQSFGRV